MAESSWTRISANTLADQVYHAVRARILDDQIAPGEFIREKDLNEAMEVSRTPIREALGRLASEGFLERLPHRGFRVPEEALSGLLELYPIVASLERLAGRLALPDLAEEDLARLEDINGELRAAKDREDVPALVELNSQFHRLFSERSGNQRLSGLLDDLRAQLTRLERWYYSHPDHAERSIEQHADIIRALKDEDPDRALSLLERNMPLTRERLLAETPEEALAELPSPTSDGKRQR